MPPQHAPWVAEASPQHAPFLKSDLTSSDLRNLQGGVSGESELDKAGVAALSQPALQPMTVGTASPISLATGDPVTDVMNSARDIIEFPSRLSQTMGAISGKADEVAKTHAEAMGLHPAVAWALGKAAGLVTDPRNLAMFVEGGVPNLKGSDFPLLGNFGGELSAKNAALAEKMGVQLSPAEATGTKLLNVIEDLGNIYPYTGDDFQNFYKTRLAQADDIRSSLINKVGNNAATKEVSDMMKKQITDYLQTATPEQAAYLQDRFGDLDAYMKKPAAGQFVQSMLAQNRKLSLDAAGAQFDALRKIVPDEAPIKTPAFTAKAKEFLNQELQGKVSDQNAGWVKRLKEYAGIKEDDGLMMEGQPVSGPLAEAIQKQLAKQAPPTEGVMPFGATQMTMRKLRDLRIAHDAGYLSGIKGQGDTYSGYAAELRKALHEDIDAGLSTLSDQAKQALKEAPPTDPSVAGHLEQMGNVAEKYKTARTNYAQTKELMNDPFIIKLLKNDPEDFLDHAVKANDITNVAKLKAIVGPDNFVPVKQNLLANMLVDKEGEINPQSFVRKVEKIGMPTMTKVFDTKELTEIGEVQQVFSMMKRGFTEGSQTGGRLMAKATLFGAPLMALKQILAGEPLKAIGTIIGVTGIPKALAKLYLSETGREMLIKGIGMPDNAALSLSLLSKGAMMSALENTKASAEPTAMPGQMPGTPMQIGNQ
jgi:hypothetical protein